MMGKMTPRGMTLLALLAALPAGGEPSAARTPSAGLEFYVQYFGVHGRRQDTATYDFDGDGKPDILNSSIDFDVAPPERWAAVHLLRGDGFSEKPDWIWALSARACALVFGDYLPGGGTEVGFVAEDGVYVYPYGKGAPAETPLKIIHSRTFFHSPPARQIPVWSWRQDLDGNGLDDLVLPLPDGYRVYFQTAHGVFGRTSSLEADMAANGDERILAAQRFAVRPEVLPAHFTSTVELPRVEAVNVNDDGRVDLVTISKGALTCFLQTKEGTYLSARRHRVTMPVVTLAEEKKKDTVNLSMVKFVDINRDGLSDLVVTKVVGTLGFWDSIKTSIVIHRGTGRGNFEPQEKILIDGVSIDPEFIDMDGDGALDAFTSRLRTDLVKQGVNVLIAGDLPLSYEVFQYEKSKGAYREAPVFAKQIYVTKEDLEKTGMGAVPLVFVRGDLTGDGRPDLVHVDPNPKRGGVNIHPGRLPFQSTEGIDFDATPHHAVRLDRHPKGVQIMDVNGDGINDVLLYYAGTLGAVLSRRR